MTLDEIALKHKTDKSSKGHGYCEFYEQYLGKLRDQPIILMEAGVGGYKFPDRGGESLRTWREYFSNENALVIGFDLYSKRDVNIPGAKIYQGAQDDETFLNWLVEYDGQPDVFIDDASHVNPLTIRTFEIMFPLLKPGGIYIIEDIHTGLWTTPQDPENDYKGNPEPMANGTILHYIARLTYGLHADTIRPDYRGPFDGHIESMHIYRNTCLIKKRKQ